MVDLALARYVTTELFSPVYLKVWHALRVNFLAPVDLSKAKTYPGQNRVSTVPLKKSRIRETPTLSTNADSSTDTIKSNQIRNTSLFLRLHVGTIHKSIPKHLLVFKAPCGDDPRVQEAYNI